MKEEIDAMIAQYGQENAPPPWATFTIANDIKEGNMHVVQKIFEGPFEVRWRFGVTVDLFTDRLHSLTLCIHQRPLRRQSRVSQLSSTPCAGH